VQLGVADMYNQLSSSPPIGDGPMDLWTYAVDPSVKVVRCLLEGMASEIAVDAHPIEPGLLFRHLTAVFVVVILALVVAIVWKRGGIAWLLQHSPQAATAVVGFAWWLWLWPSFLGLIILLVGIFSTARRLWLPNR
jgi:hypothetical protein